MIGNPLNQDEISGILANDEPLSREQLLKLLQAISGLERALRELLGVSPVYTERQYRQRAAKQN